MKYLFITMLVIGISSILRAQLSESSPRTFDKRCLRIDSLEKAAANGSNHAMFLLAASYDTILNTYTYIVPNCGMHQSAIYWYTQMADMGDIVGIVNLGLHYNHLAMYDSAYSYYVKAYKLGDGRALLSLYEYSKLKRVSKEKRFDTKWLFKTIEKEALLDRSVSYNLGMAYEYELHGIKKNLSKAIYWFRVAANLGNESALYPLKRLEKQK